jgi:hypothetical protein
MLLFILVVMYSAHSWWMWLMRGMSCTIAPLLKLARRVEVQMTVAFMPQPGITVCMSAEAERVPNLDPEKVEAVCQAMHLSNQPPSVVVDLQDAMSCVHVATTLVELPEAYNVGGEPRDKVHPP